METLQVLVAPYTEAAQKPGLQQEDGHPARMGTLPKNKGTCRIRLKTLRRGTCTFRKAACVSVLAHPPPKHVARAPNGDARQLASLFFESLTQ